MKLKSRVFEMRGAPVFEDVFHPPHSSLGRTLLLVLQYGRDLLHPRFVSVSRIELFLMSLQNNGHFNTKWKETLGYISRQLSVCFDLKHQSHFPHFTQYRSVISTNFLPMDVLKYHIINLSRLIQRIKDESLISPNIY